jgi:hypothetical protein
MLILLDSRCIIPLFGNIEEKLMSATTFMVVVRLSNGMSQRIRVEADCQASARAMIESQFGRGCILAGPWRA